MLSTNYTCAVNQLYLQICIASRDPLVADTQLYSRQGTTLSLENVSIGAALHGNVIKSALAMSDDLNMPAC